MSPISRRQTLGVIGGSIGVGVFGHGVSGRASAQTRSGEAVWEAKTIQKSRLGEETNLTLADGIIYAGTARDNDAEYVDEEVPNEIFALDAGSGAVEWRREIGNTQTRFSPTLLDGTVIFPTTSQNRNAESPLSIIAVDAATGDEQWTFSGTFGNPVIADGTVFVVRQNDALYALDAATGSEQWTFEDPDGEASPISIDDGTLYAGINRDEDYLLAIDAETATEQWAFQTDARRSFVVDAGSVYVPDADTGGVVDAVDASSGTQQWRFEAETTTPFSVITMGTESIYVGHGQGQMYALSPTDGTARWNLSTGVGEGAIVEQSGRVYVGGRSGIRAVDAATGEEQWGTEMDATYTSTSVVDGTVYINNFAVGNQSDGGLYGFDGESGEQLWSYELEFGSFFPPVAASGTVITADVGTDRIYAVQSTAQSGEETTTGPGETRTESPTEGGEQDEQDDPDEATATGRDDSGGSQETSGAAGPGFGITEVLASVGGGTYLLKRFTRDDDS